MRNKLLIFCFIAGTALGITQKNPEYEKKTFIEGNDSLNYRVLMPTDFEEQKKYPLVLFLHGAGERGSDNESQLLHGSSLFTDPLNRGAFPAIVLFPQCPKESYWAQVQIDRSSYPIALDFEQEKEPTPALQSVMHLVEDYSKKSFVDTNRIYVIGLSMGGMGTFEILWRLPDIFAAAIPICGAGVPELTMAYAKRVSLWIFHGAQDNVLAPKESVKMVQELLSNGARPRFTLYDFAGHGSWDPAFAEPQLLPWLFSHRKNTQP